MRAAKLCDLSSWPLCSLPVANLHTDCDLLQWPVVWEELLLCQIGMESLELATARYIVMSRCLGPDLTEHMEAKTWKMLCANLYPCVAGQNNRLGVSSIFLCRLPGTLQCKLLRTYRGRDGGDWWWFVFESRHDIPGVLVQNDATCTGSSSLPWLKPQSQIKSSEAGTCVRSLSLCLSLMSFPLVWTPVWYHWSRFNIIRCTCPSIHYLIMNLLYNLAQSNSTLTYPIHPIRASVYSLFVSIHIFSKKRLCLRVFGLTTFQALLAGKVLHLLTCKDMRCHLSLFGNCSGSFPWLIHGYLNYPSLVIGCHWFGLLMKRLRILGLMHRDIKPENFRFKDRATTTLQVGWLLNAYNTWSKVVLHVCMFAFRYFFPFTHVHCNLR